MTWCPATADEVVRIVAQQLAGCTVEEQEFFGKIRVALRRHPIERLGHQEEVFAVATWRGRVLFWEDVEEGFEWAEPDADGIIRRYGASQFELRHVLRSLLDEP
jgi:hypothetical protein